MVGRNPGSANKFQVRINGGTQLITDFSNMAQATPAAVTQYLNVMASRFLDKLTKFAPIDTGEYLRSWRVIAQESNRIVIAPSNIPRIGTRGSPLGGGGGNSTGNLTNQQLAVILEFSGANQHEIRPRTPGGALRVTSGGGEFFFTLVNHPGTRPRPHIRPALAELMREAKGVAYAVLASTIPAKNRAWKNSMTKAARANGYEGPIPPKQVGRSSIDTSANIGRGTKASFGPKLSRGLSGKRLRARGLTRLVGSSESGRKGITKIGGTARGQGLERFR